MSEAEIRLSGCDVKNGCEKSIIMGLKDYCDRDEKPYNNRDNVSLFIGRAMTA